MRWVDPQAQLIVEMTEAAMAANSSGAEPDIELSRQGGRMAKMDLPLADVHEVRDFEIPGDPSMLARAWIPRRAEEGEQLPVLLYFTGATFMNTELDDFPAGLLSTYAVDAECIVVVPLHRKPPESRYPAAFEDCLLAYEWVLGHAAELGGDATRIALMGESSGGTLVAWVCQRARDRGLPQPLMQVMFEPLLDFLSYTPSMFTGSGLIDKATLDFGTRLYFGDDWPDNVPVDASPLRYPDLTGLAHAYIVTAEFDPLRDEAIAYTARLRAAGVRVSYLCYEGQFHGFMGFPMLVAESVLANDQFLGALRMAFRRAAKS